MKVILLGSLSVFLVYLLAGCSTEQPVPKIIAVDETMDSDSVELRVNDQIEVSLPGNPTTGYEWVLKEVDNTILEPLGEPEYQSESDAVGGGGHYTLQFKAIASGDTLIEMAYRRLFESDDTPSADEFKLIVKVRG